MLGDGPARALLLSGDLINGADAHRLGLATHLATSSAATLSDARAHCQSLSAKGVHALRTTKAWLNELDGLRASGPDLAAEDSAMAAAGAETRRMLSAHWSKRRSPN
jgi:enoyl-CoA hydratase/carnithine racemase